MGDYIAYEALTIAGFQVERACDHFPKGTKDVEWLPIVGERGWVVLTKDQKIRKCQLEREVLFNSNVAAFILTSGDVEGRVIAQAYIKARHKMLRLLAKHRRPFIATVTKDGVVSMKESSDD